jgi:hypothetical protein
MLWRKVLEWLLSRASLRVYTSPQPLGRRLGGADIVGVTDKYLILEVSLQSILTFIGFWQLS